MPANLTPQYLEAERRYKEATNPQEKLLALKEMYSVMPKHKGTDKLQADVKRRISKLADEMQQTRKAGRRYSEFVKKEGAGQVVLIGPPNSGKSSIVNLLTHAEPEVAPYPFTTKKPLPAMMPYKDIQIQLVDMPPITESYYEGWFSNIVREGDLVFLVAGLDDLDPDGSLKAVIDHLGESGIQFTGEDVSSVGTPDYRTSMKHTFVILNKTDLGGAGIFKELIKPVIGDIPIYEISCLTGEGIEPLRETIYKTLSIVRVYTKKVGKKPDMSKPYVIKVGTTVVEFAAQIHKDFRDNLKFARVWGHTKFEGQPVEKGYVLEDGDVIEIHI
ncbi:MAG: GTPase [Candidatus Eisenbacteria bacterium]